MTVREMITVVQCSMLKLRAKTFPQQEVSDPDSSSDNSPFLAEMVILIYFHDGDISKYRSCTP